LAGFGAAHAEAYRYYGSNYTKDKLNALTPGQIAKQPWVPGMFKPLSRNMLDIDAPDHSQLLRPSAPSAQIRTRRKLIQESGRSPPF
jgi:cytochrome P450 PksS